MGMRSSDKKITGQIMRSRKNSWGCFIRTSTDFDCTNRANTRFLFLFHSLGQIIILIAILVIDHAETDLHGYYSLGQTLTKCVAPQTFNKHWHNP
jgi:phosphoketolase